MAGRFFLLPHNLATLTESSILKIPLLRSNHRMHEPCTWGDARSSFKNCQRWMWELPVVLDVDGFDESTTGLSSSSSANKEKNSTSIYYQIVTFLVLYTCLRNLRPQKRIKYSVRALHHLLPLSLIQEATDLTRKYNSTKESRTDIFLPPFHHVTF